MSDANNPNQATIDSAPVDRVAVNPDATGDGQADHTALPAEAGGTIAFPPRRAAAPADQESTPTVDNQQKDSGRCYASAAALAEDLRRYLNNEPAPVVRVWEDCARRLFLPGESHHEPSSCHRPRRPPVRTGHRAARRHQRYAAGRPAAR